MPQKWRSVFLKILTLSNSSFGPYGYGRVIKNVAHGLRGAGHRVVNFGIQTMGTAMQDELGTWNWPLRFDVWGRDGLGDYIKSFQPDVVVTLLDLFMREVSYIPETIKSFGVPWVAHCTIGSDSLSPYLAQPLRQANMIVAPSNFNYGIVKASGLPVTFIPHGVDTSRFYPLKEDEKREAKQKLGAEGKRLIGIVQRNNILQKNFFGAFWAYKILIENVPRAKKDTLLVCLSYPFEERGVRLTDLAAHLGIQDNVRFVMVKPDEEGGKLELAHFNDPRAFVNNPNWGLDEDEMRKLYNSFDFTVIPSLGESCSLPALESQACGVPVVMSEFSTGKEMLTDDEPSPRGAVVKLRGLWDIPLLSRVGIPDEGDMARRMHDLLSDDNLRRKYGRNGVEYIRNNRTWTDHVVPLWLKLLAEFDKPKPVNYMTGEMGI